MKNTRFIINANILKNIEPNKINYESNTRKKQGKKDN